MPAGLPPVPRRAGAAGAGADEPAAECPDAIRTPAARSAAADPAAAGRNGAGAGGDPRSPIPAAAPDAATCRGCSSPSSPPSPGGGLGLGLSVSHGLIRGMGGDHRGRGTRGDGGGLHRHPRSPRPRRSCRLTGPRRRWETASPAAGRFSGNAFFDRRMVALRTFTVLGFCVGSHAPGSRLTGHRMALELPHAAPDRLAAASSRSRCALPAAGTVEACLGPLRLIGFGNLDPWPLSLAAPRCCGAGAPLRSDRPRQCARLHRQDLQLSPRSSDRRSCRPILIGPAAALVIWACLPLPAFMGSLAARTHSPPRSPAA